MKRSTHHLTNSEIIKEVPAACQDETKAVEFFEKQRWGNTPCCVHCGSVSVYKMMDRATGLRSKRFLWRCNDCKKQYTVRIGAVYEESRLPMRHWAYAYWRAATSKKGVAALEIKRHCQISYVSALFLMNRIRFAMAPDPKTAPKLEGIVEVDEVYIGGKPRKNIHKAHKRGRGTDKTPVFVAVQRNGGIRRRVIPNVTAKTIPGVMKELIDDKARIMSDESNSYKSVGQHFGGGHETVMHTAYEFARGDVHTNTAESSNALVKRGLMGIYHNVSRQYLHRYLWQWDFVWDHRQLNDGERLIASIKTAEGKRLMYKAALAS